MEIKYIRKLIGKNCRIVFKKPTWERQTEIIGIIEEVHTDPDLLIVDIKGELEVIDIKYIIAIKQR